MVANGVRCRESEKQWWALKTRQKNLQQLSEKKHGLGVKSTWQYTPQPTMRTLDTSFSLHSGLQFLHQNAKAMSQVGNREPLMVSEQKGDSRNAECRFTWRVNGGSDPEGRRTAHVFWGDESLRPWCQARLLPPPLPTWMVLSKCVEPSECPWTQ